MRKGRCRCRVDIARFRGRWHTTVISTDPSWHSTRHGETGITHSLMGVGEVGKEGKKVGCRLLGLVVAEKRERRNRKEESKPKTTPLGPPPPVFASSRRSRTLTRR